MSHLATVKSQIVYISALRTALQNMGLSLQVGGRPRFYYDQSEANVNCDYVIPLPGRYDLGLKQQVDGTYAFVCDSELMSGSYGRGSEGREILGENADRLMAEYAWAVAQTEASMNNYMATRETLANGDVVIVLERYN